MQTILPFYGYYVVDVADLPFDEFIIFNIFACTVVSILQLQKKRRKSVQLNC